MGCDVVLNMVRRHTVLAGHSYTSSLATSAADGLINLQPI
jgi:xylose isomerase